MAEQNPTGDGAPVALSIPSDQLRFLRSTFSMSRDGLHEELERFGDKLPEPEQLRRQLASHTRLLAGLHILSIVPDQEVRELVAHLAEVTDAANEYRRVVAEHAALHGLLAQIGCSAEGG